ncbi:MAG: hypothetical protein SR3Q1_05320 [Quinella sp. 3Q1]|nr:hypothetical protein [Quinella sp. 3Q1]MBR3050697.1 hypothetical protein [Selenomonadaceae bacterium]
MVDDIERNYKGLEIGKRFDDKWRVVSVGEGTPESLIERLTARKKTKLIYLIAEEN